MARFCPKCGAEVPEDAVFCSKCGSTLSTPTGGGVVYRKEHSSGWGLGSVLSIIFGGFMLFVALGLVVGGGTLVWSQNALTDGEGYMVTTPTRLAVSSYAIVQDDIDVHMGSGWMMNPTSADIVSIKVSVDSNTNQPVFVGIAQRQYVENYLSGVNVDRLITYAWAPVGVRASGTPVYQTITGGAPSAPPTAQSFWVASSSGTGTQTVTWTPTSGEYWIVVMNADGSKAVDVDALVGARVTILNWIGWGLLFGGFIVAFVGVAVIYFGVFRRR